MDECTYSSQPGGILPCVCHPAVLCVVPSEELYVSQRLGAGAAGEDPGQPPRSWEGVLQQRAMSVQPPHPNTAITQLQAQSSPLCQPSSFSVPKLSLCLLISTIQMDVWGLPLSVSLFVMRCLLLSMWLLILLLTAWEDFLPEWAGWKVCFTMTDIVARVRPILNGHFTFCTVFSFVKLVTCWSYVAAKPFSHSPT